MTVVKCGSEASVLEKRKRSCQIFSLKIVYGLIWAPNFPFWPTAQGQTKSGLSDNWVGRCRKERFKRNGNFLGGCKQGGIEQIGMKEECGQLCWPQVAWCCSELLVVVVVNSSISGIPDFVYPEDRLLYYFAYNYRKLSCLKKTIAQKDFESR